MNTMIWIIQGILGAMFTMAGIMKSTQPKGKLAESLPWVNDYSLRMVRFIGISELLGAIALIVPMIVGVAPVLTPISAAALAIVMILAAGYHVQKGEYKAVVFNAVLFTLSAIIAYFRF